MTNLIPISSRNSHMTLFYSSFRSQFGGPDILETGEDGSGGEDPSPSSRYGLLSTLYFHILTGPLGAYVRLSGDALAWLATVFSRRVRAVVKQVGRRMMAIAKLQQWRRGGNDMAQEVD